MLACMAVDRALREDSDPEPPDLGDTDPVALQLTPILAREEGARMVAQVYALERLAAGDLLTARPLLRALALALDTLGPEVAAAEYAPFAFTLARRASLMLAAGRLSPGSGDDSSGDPLWALIVDRLLLRLVDGEIQVHEEVLRLLLAAAPTLGAVRVAQGLSEALQRSTRSRKRFKKRKLELVESDAAAALGLAASEAVGTAAPGGGYGQGFSCGWSVQEGFPKVAAAAGLRSGGGGGDGVRATYGLFPQRVPGLTPDLAPELFAYLEQQQH
jgi:hypothetical protein